MIWCLQTNTKLHQEKIPHNKCFQIKLKDLIGETYALPQGEAASPLFPFPQK